MNHGLQTLKSEREKIASEAQRTKISLTNIRAQLKDAEEKGQLYERQLKELDAAIKAMPDSP